MLINRNSDKNHIVYFIYYFVNLYMYVMYKSVYLIFKYFITLEYHDNPK